MTQKGLKDRIRSGEIVVGVQVPIDVSRSRLEDILGRDDYGFLAADSQHVPYNEEKLVSFCKLANDLRIPVQFRIKHTRLTYLIGNVLDLGPLAIEVPQVEEEDTVDEAIDYFYYPQVGKRSWGGEARYGIDGREDRLVYADWWNSNGVLCLQIESIRSVIGAAKLAKPGIDCLTWGPNDLIFDMESHRNPPFTTVDECVEHALKELEGSETKISFRSFDHNLRQKYIDMGVTVLMERPRN